MFGRYHRVRRAATITAVMCGIGLATVGCRKRDPEARINHMAEHIKDKLDLNESQALLLDSLRDEVRAVAAAFKTESGTHLNALITQVTQPDLDQAAIAKMVGDHRGTIDRHMPALLTKLAAFHKSLNDAQKQELVEYLEKAQRWMR